MNWRPLLLTVLAIVVGSAVAQLHAKGKLGSSFTGGGGSGGTPGGTSTQLQFNTNSTFGGISGVTSDSANVGFTTSSQLILYGLSVGDCLKIGANNQIADSGGACGGTGSPGGLNTQVQFNTNGTFGGVSGAVSTNASVIAFSTNSLVINGQAISKVSGTTGTLATITGTLGSGNCVQLDAFGNLVDSGNATCGGITTSSTNIAAGTNITTSGTTSNVTVNVVAAPSFTTVIASGNITAGSAQFAGFLTAGGASISGLNLATGTISGNLTGATANFSGNLTGTTAQFTGALTGTSATFQTVTDAGFTAATQCVQATNGVLAGTGVGCATQTSTPSIAAGTNITTSGTAANTTVNVVATPSFTTVIATGNLTAGSAQFAGFLTAGGASISGLSLATGTMSGNLTGTTHNLSGNLTAGTAQFTGAVTGTTAVFQTITDALLGGCLNATSGVISSTGVSCATQTSTPSIAAGTNITTSGTAANTTINLVATPSVTTLIASGNLTAATAQFSGFLTAGGASLSGLTIVTETLSGNLTGTTANFSGNLTGTTAQFTGAVTGTSAQFQTYNGATANLTSNLTGSTAQFSGQVTGTTAVFQTVTAQNFTTLAQGFVPASSNAAGAFLKGDATFGTPTTIGLASSTTTTPQGWLNWAGQGRTTADTVGFTTTGFGNLITITGLVAGRTYKFEAEIPVKAAVAATGGIAIRIGGGATATSVVYDGYIVDFGSTGGVSNGTKGSAQATALSSSVANATLSGTTGHITVVGTITVNAGGSLILQGGGFTTVTAASAVTAARGATFLIYDIP